MAKDRQLGAWSSSWAKIALAFLVGGIAASIAHLVVPGNLSVNVALGLFTVGVLILVADRLTYRRRSHVEWREYEANRQNAKREARFRAIISASADAFIEIAEDGSIVNWNEKASALFGWTAGEVLGQNIVSLLVKEDDRERVSERLRELWYAEDRGEGKYITGTAQNRSGRTLYLESTIWVDEVGGQRMNFFMRDHTDRHEVEQAVQKALADEREAVLRLQELDRVKNDFVSSVSHELRSPLTSTLGYLELLLDGDAGELDPQQGRMIEIAARNAKRLQTLIEDLLTLSRIESGSFRVQFRPVDIQSTIHASVQRNTVVANERNVRLSLHGMGAVGVVAGDKNELTRGISNIISNAVKFTPPGGTVDIVVTRTHERVAIAVKDTGIGIPAEEQANLFSRFYRASAAVTGQHQGAGLGLTIAKTIFEHHGGSIAVESSPEDGTLVTIELPALPLDESVTPGAPTTVDTVVL